MNDDDIYPNAGDTYYAMNVPENQEEDERKEQSELISQAPVIQAILDHLTERIAYFGSVLAVDEFDDPTKFMYQTFGNKAAYETLLQEKEALELLIKEYK